MIGAEGGDSCGISGTGETPQERSDEEAHRPPRGKRPPGAEINTALRRIMRLLYSKNNKGYEKNLKLKRLYPDYFNMSELLNVSNFVYSSKTRM
ncbi:hypothetical protein [Bacillus fonticola]|uniref:hypothetical protein n=1 Tax=Bacillus fonticola TaxID=2728853 RepID=UPI001D13DCE8|nr:hypothetical protein [Bacillus fonticola]